MPELEMNVGVIWRPRQPFPISRLGFRQPPGVLQHVAVLDADVGSRRRQSNRVPVSRSRVYIIPRVPQAVPLEDIGFARLLGRRHRLLRDHPERAELGGRGSTVRQQSLGVAIGGNRLLFAPGQLQQVSQLQMDVAIFGGLRQRQTVGRFRFGVTPLFLQHVAQLNSQVGSSGAESQRQRVELCRQGICLAAPSPIRSTSQLPRQVQPAEYAMEGAHRRSSGKCRRDPLRAAARYFVKTSSALSGPASTSRDDTGAISPLSVILHKANPYARSASRKPSADGSPAAKNGFTNSHTTVKCGCARMLRMPSTIIGSLPSASILTRSIARASPRQYSSSVVAGTATVVFFSRYNARNSSPNESMLPLP